MCLETNRIQHRASGMLGQVQVSVVRDAGQLQGAWSPSPSVWMGLGTGDLLQESKECLLFVASLASKLFNVKTYTQRYNTRTLLVLAGLWWLQC